MNRTTRILWSALWVIAAAARTGYGQDCAACETTTAVFLSGDFTATNASAWVDIDVNGVSIYEPPTVSVGSNDLVPNSVALKPGKTYNAIAYGESVSGYRLHLNPGPGYVVYVNDLQRNLWDRSSTSLNPSIGDQFAIRVEVDPGNGFTPAGEALPLTNGKVVWRVGMGQLRNGKSAGYLALRQEDINAETFRISSLIYESPSPEVDRVPNTETLSQVRAPFGLATITGSDNNYTISFYASATGPDGNGNYTPSGSAFVTYQVTSQSGGTVLRADRVRGSSTWRTEITKVTSTQWRMTDWHRVVSGIPETPVRYDVRDLTSAGLVEDAKIQDAITGTIKVATRTQNTYANKPWGAKELMQVARNYNGTSGENTGYTYYENSNEHGRYAKIKSIAPANGNWVQYDYFNDLLQRGNIYREYRPFLDNPATPTASATSGRVTTFTYSYTDWSGQKNYPTYIETRIDNVVTGKSSIAYSVTDVNGQKVRTETRTEYDTTSTSLVTTIKTYDKNSGDSYYRDQPYSIRRPDGTVDAYVYQPGFYDPVTKVFVVSGTGGARRQLIFKGANSAGAVPNCTQYTSYQGVTMDSVWMITDQSVLEEWVTNIDGRLIYSRKYLFTGNGAFSSMDGIYQTSNTPQGVPTSILDFSRATNFWAYQSTWVDGQKTSETDADGIVTNFTYDTLGRVKTRTVAAKGNIPALVTTFSYDADNRVIKEERGSTSPITREWVYDLAGRIKEEKVPGEGGLKTTFYVYSNGGRNVNIDYPDTSERDTVRHLDGRVKQITGSAGSPEYYTYTRDATTGRITTRRQLSSASGDSDGWVKTEVDWLGRVRDVSRPTYNNVGVHKVTHTYDGTKGYLTRRDTKVGATDIDAPEHYTYTPMALPLTVGLDVDGSGIATGGNDRIQEFAYTSWLSGASRYAKTEVFIYPQIGSSTKLSVAATSRLISGFSTTLSGEERTSDITGATSTAQRIVDKTNAKVEWQTTLSGVSNVAKSITQNGLTIQTVSHSPVTVDFSYDGYGRLTTEDGYDVKKTAYTYHSGTDLVHEVRTFYEYGANDSYPQAYYNYDNANRVKRHLDSHGKFIRYNYAPSASGLEVYQWGTAGHPMKKVYNSYGWMTAMRTYRSGTWTGDTDTKPADFTNLTGDVTTWAYDAWTGLNTSKTDAASKTVSYTYNNRFQVSRRTHARKTHGGTKSVWADYDYFDATSNLTGELEAVYYKVGNPQGTFTPDPITTDLAYTYTRSGRLATVADKLGTRSLTYNGKLKLTREDFDSTAGKFLGDVELNHLYETSGLYRRNEVKLGSSTNTTRDHRDVFAFSASTGRIATITRHWSGGSQAFTYGYRGGTDLVESITGGSYRRDINWQWHRDVEDIVETKWGTSVKATYTYGTDLEGRRISADVEGELPTKFASTYGYQMTWTYTDRSEVDVTRTRHLDVGGSPTGAWNTTWERDWNWDAFSNRTKDDRYGTTQDTTYVPNSLNQYSSISGYQAESPYSFDEDGNLKQDGTWNYQSDSANAVTYDGENRVVKMVKTGVTLSFDYDYLGRRVRKVATGGAEPGTFEYVYDGWNLLAVYKNDALKSSFTWGLDKSGTLGGAGGTGGLLLERTAGANLFPTVDARGNVTGLLSSTGILTRAYQFDAFGERIASWLITGVTDLDYIGFASKYTDVDSGLVNFGFRLYSPKHGRFVNRDPIGEAGGEHLYAHTWNDPVNHIDVLGLGWEYLCDYAVVDGPVDPLTGEPRDDAPQLVVVCGWVWNPDGGGSPTLPPDFGNGGGSGGGGIRPPMPPPKERPTPPGQAIPLGDGLGHWERAANNAQENGRTMSDLRGAAADSLFIGPLSPETIAKILEYLFPPPIPVGEINGQPIYVDFGIGGGLRHVSNAGRIVGVGKGAAATVAKDAVRFHHPWPKYLGGEVQQILEALPRSVHDAFHSGLDKILPRQVGTAYYEALSPAARTQALQDLAAYTKAFDAKHGTHLYEAMVREGFPR